MLPGESRGGWDVEVASDKAFQSAAGTGDVVWMDMFSVRFQKEFDTAAAASREIFFFFFF